MTFDGNWLALFISKDTSPVNKLWLARMEGGGLPSDGNNVR